MFKTHSIRKPSGCLHLNSQVQFKKFLYNKTKTFTRLSPTCKRKYVNVLGSLLLRFNDSFSILAQLYPKFVIISIGMIIKIAQPRSIIQSKRHIFTCISASIKMMFCVYTIKSNITQKRLIYSILISSHSVPYIYKNYSAS